MHKKILVGSRYFFGRISGFNSKDSDYVQIYEPGLGFEYIRQITFVNRCYFLVIRRPKQEILQWALEKEPSMLCGKFLVPEVCKEFGITLEDIKVLKPRFDSMDEKHQYEKIIYDSYVENNSMTLTEEQRLKAYASYLETRKNNNE